MNRDKIKILKLVCYLFGFFWIYNAMTGFYSFYITELQMCDKEIFLIKIAAFVIGVILSLVTSGGFTILFWYSYRLKYMDERICDNIAKKIITFLFSTGVFKAAFGFSIFILSLFFTIIVLIRYLEKESSAINYSH